MIESRLLLAAQLDAFLTDLERQARPNTVSAYRSDLTLAAQHLTMPLDQIGMNDVVTFLSTAAMTAATRYRRAASLKRFFAWAVQQGLCTANPLSSYRGQHHTRRIPPYHTITEPTERRLAVIRLHSEGWTKQSIAEYLQTSRQTVHETLQRWVEEGIGGLYDKSRAPKQPARKVNLETIAAVRRLQRNPELGAFRIQAALKQLGIEVSLRTCSRLLALNRALYAGLDPDPPETVRQPMPFAAHRRHQYWTVDIRYLDMHQLGGGQIYAITILENYSRAILASAVSRTQDTAAYLMVLYAAIEQHGSPETLISDGGSVFRSTQAQRIYQAMQVHHQRIDPGQSWQSYIEANFNVMRRMTNWHVTRATSWAELVQVHETWVHDFNHQDHWAHRQRQDGRQSPAEVLSWVRGRIWDAPELHRIFYTVRFDRVLDRAGYVRFRHWRLYAEDGLAREAVMVWLYADRLTVAYADQPLAYYRVRYAADGYTLEEVAEPELLATDFRSPQLSLWVLSEDEWLKILQVARPRRRPRPIPEYTVEQHSFLHLVG